MLNCIQRAFCDRDHLLLLSLNSECGHTQGKVTYSIMRANFVWSNNSNSCNQPPDDRWYKITFHNPYRGPHRVYFLGVNITDINNNIIGGYSIMVLPAQERVTAVTHVCAHPHRHSLCTIPPLHFSTPLTSSVTSCIESMRPL